MIYAGCDVGGQGGVFAMTKGRIPILKEAVPFSKGGVDYEALVDIFREIMKDNLGDDIILIIEDVHSLFGMSAKSNFSFGHIKGFKEGVSIALGIEYHLVTPKVWQRVVWEEQDIVLNDKGKRDTKATSLRAAQRIFPDVDFRKSERARVPHDGIVDAALMAEYCRIINN